MTSVFSKRDYKFYFKNIFDTHRAALLLGFKQLSLEKNDYAICGRGIEKKQKNAAFALG